KPIYLCTHTLTFKEQAILIAGQGVATNALWLFSRSSIDLIGFEMTQHAGCTALAEAYLTPQDIKVCEPHYFSASETIVLDALGLSGRIGTAQVMAVGGTSFTVAAPSSMRLAGSSQRAIRSALATSRSVRSWCGTYTCGRVTA
ncbi:hypothetical protein LTR28_003186, partial [Elasticomyces elasticus]